MERAFAEYQRADDDRGAARAALRIADACNESLQTTRGKAWLQRAARLLEGRPQTAEHGYLQLALSRIAYDSGELERALEHATSVLDIGTRFGDHDLQAFGLALSGNILVSQGKIDEGLASVDEAAVAAVAGELSPMTTGIVYCITILVCRDLADYQRAGEWTEAAARWCERQAINGFPGICRVHRAEIMRLRGSWLDAEDEARRAADELIAYGKSALAGAGHYEIGEIRLRIGDLDAAEAAFAEAHQLGHEPQPGLALLHLARHRADAARAAISTALADTWEPLARARLLPARVEISLAVHDIADAREGAVELRGIADKYKTPALHAAAHQALGMVLTYEDDPAAAIVELRRAVRHWNDVDVPFEAAQARRCLAIAFRAGGDPGSSTLELNAARAVFERLGAAPEVVRCDDLARSGLGQAGRRVRRTFMFTDIVGSTSLLQTIGDEAWEDILRWHDETLRRVIGAHRGQLVQTTGDGVFAAFEDADDALDCAVAIQRRLLDHRKQHGFAPPIRIGIHSSDATMIADDYAGIGVHAAARVGGIADGGEILVTVATIGERTRFARIDERTVTLKGLEQPVRVAGIDWRSGEDAGAGPDTPAP